MAASERYASDAARPSDVGTEDDFARFFESVRTSAKRLAWLLTRDERTAEDVMQEAFTAVYPHLDKLHQPAAYCVVPW